MSTLSANIGRAIKRFFLFLIIQGLSRHSKRTLFVTSLYYSLVDDKDISLESLEKLNKALHVADDIKSMEFPAIIHKWIWDEELISCFCKTIENHKNSISYTKESLEDVFNIIPRWLLYGRHEDMVDDIKQLLSNTYGSKSNALAAS